MNNDIENLKKRLIYRSQYRGTKEMDKLIGSFVKNNIDNLNLESINRIRKIFDLLMMILYINFIIIKLKL